MASTIEKHMKYCEKLSFRVENIAFSRFLPAAQQLSRGPRTIEHARVVVFFFESQAKYLRLELATSRSSRVT